MALADQLEGYWSCDEASSSLLDSTVNARHFTDNNTIGAGTGKVSGARDLEAGSSEYFSHAGWTWYTAWTLALWIKIESFSDSYMAVWSRDDSGSPRTQSTLYIKSNGKLAVYIDAPNVEFDGTGANTLSTGVWYFIVFKYSAATGIQVYVNDVLDIDTAHTHTPRTNSVAINIGRDLVTSARFFDGLIDEIGLWSRVISTGEGTDLFNSNNGRNYAYITGGSPITENAVPVVATASVVAPTVTLSQAPSPVAAVSSVVGVTVSLSIAPAPVTAASSVVALEVTVSNTVTPVQSNSSLVDPVYSPIQLPSPNALSGSVNGVTTSLSFETVPVEAPTVVPTAEDIRVESVDPTSSVSGVTGYVSSLIFSTAAVQTISSVVSPIPVLTVVDISAVTTVSDVVGLSTTLNYPPSSIISVSSIATPFISGTPIVEFPDPVTTASSVTSVTTTLIQSSDPVTTSSSVTSTGTIISNAGSVVQVATSQVQVSTVLNYESQSVSVLSSVSPVSAIDTTTPSSLSINSVVVQPTTVLTISQNPVVVITIVPVVTTHGGDVEVLPDPVVSITGVVSPFYNLTFSPVPIALLISIVQPIIISVIPPIIDDDVNIRFVLDPDLVNIKFTITTDQVNMGE